MLVAPYLRNCATENLKCIFKYFLIYSRGLIFVGIIQDNFNLFRLSPEAVTREIKHIIIIFIFYFMTDIIKIKIVRTY